MGALEDVHVNAGFGLIHLGGRGFISTFGRGGPWCGLKDTAGVVQVYSLPGITNVNGIYDTQLRASLDLRKGQWHHCAMVINAASLVSVYTDGRLAFETRAAGRAFSADDAFKTLYLGGGVALDEVMVLRTPLTAGEIEQYVTAMRQVKVAYPSAK